MDASVQRAWATSAQAVATLTPEPLLLLHPVAAIANHVPNDVHVPNNLTARPGPGLVVRFMDRHVRRRRAARQTIAVTPR